MPFALVKSLSFNHFCPNFYTDTQTNSLTLSSTIRRFPALFCRSFLLIHPLLFSPLSLSLSLSLYLLPIVTQCRSDLASACQKCGLIFNPQLESNPHSPRVSYEVFEKCTYRDRDAAYPPTSPRPSSGSGNKYQRPSFQSSHHHSSRGMKHVPSPRDTAPTTPGNMKWSTPGDRVTLDRKTGRQM